MKLRDKLIAGLAVLLLLLVGLLWLTPGALKQAPELTLTTLQGRSLQLAELRGRPLLVTFWATTCPGCMKEMPHLITLYEELAPRGLEIIGVAMNYDPIEDVKALSARRKVPYLIAHDSRAEAARAFGDVQLTPTTFVIAPDGRIVQQTIGEVDMTQLRSKLLSLLKQG